MHIETAEPSSGQTRIAATLALSDTARHWDAIVIGAGCAGSVMARQLSLAGRAVLLVDKLEFPRAKVCGCCLNAAALELFAGVGLGNLTSSLGAVPLRSLSLAAGRATALLTIPGGAALSRESLDAGLIRAAIASGAEFLPGTVASVCEPPEQPASGIRASGARESPCVVLRAVQSARVTGNTTHASLTAEQMHDPRTSPERKRAGPAGQMHDPGTNLKYEHAGPANPADNPLPDGRGSSFTAHARCIIVADGLAGTSLSHCKCFAVTRSDRSPIGAATILTESSEHYRRGIIYMTSGVGGYVGLVRLEDGRLNVAAAIDPRVAHTAGGVGVVAANILASAKMPPLLGLHTAHWYGTPTLTRRRPTLQSGGVLVIGDAAGYVEPFTGEGMAWAFASALAASNVALGIIRDSPESEAASWTAMHRRVIGRRQRICRVVAWTLRRPSLTAAVVRVLARWPGVAGPVLRHVASPLGPPRGVDKEWTGRPARSNPQPVRPGGTPGPLMSPQMMGTPPGGIR